MRSWMDKLFLLNEAKMNKGIAINDAFVLFMYVVQCINPFFSLLQKWRCNIIR